MSVKFAHAGTPVAVNVAVGAPVTVTVKDGSLPGVMVSLLPLVNAGGAAIMSAKFCVAVPTLLVARSVKQYGEPLAAPAGGVICRIPFPPPWSLKVTQEGERPQGGNDDADTDNVGVGWPVAVTEKVEVPVAETMSLAALVNCGVAGFAGLNAGSETANWMLSVV